MVSTSCLLTVLLVAMFAQEKDASSPPNERSVEALCQSHNILFGEFCKNNNARIAWSPSDDDVLVELVASSSVTHVDGRGKVKLLPESVDLSRLFDVVLIRGKNLDGFEEAQLVRDGRSWKLERMQDKLDEPDEHEVQQQAFRIIEKPTESTVKSDEFLLEAKSTAAATIHEVVFKSTLGINRDLDKMRAFWPLQQHYVELRKSLGENSHLFNGIVGARLGAMERININSVLADRRVSRMYQTLSSMDEELAAAMAATEFEREFQRFKAMSNGFLPYFSIHALEANLFLCSEFCSRETFVEKLDGWNQWYEELAPTRTLQFGVSKPDFLFVANLLAYRIAKEKTLSTEQLNEWIFENILPLADKAYSQHRHQPDFPREMRFMLIEKPMQGIAKRVPTIESSLPFFKDSKRQARVLEKMRQELVQEEP